MRRTFFYNAPTASSLPAGCKPYNQLDYFKKIIRAYQGRDEDVVKYVKKVKDLIDKPLDGPCRPGVTQRPHEMIELMNYYTLLLAR